MLLGHVALLADISKGKDYEGNCMILLSCFFLSISITIFTLLITYFIMLDLEFASVHTSTGFVLLMLLIVKQRLQRMRLCTTGT